MTEPKIEYAAASGVGRPDAVLKRAREGRARIEARKATDPIATARAKMKADAAKRGIV